MHDLTHLSLFSGIGGIDLAAEWAGFRTVAFCEKDEYCQKVLHKHWPGVRTYDDVFRVTAKQLQGDGIEWPRILTGGFPCQPFSAAGRGLAERDPRHLWPEMLRVISEVRPAWIVGENVANLANKLVFRPMLADLEKEGYEVWPLVIPACVSNAPHRRSRVFILAHTEHGGCETWGTPARRAARHPADGLRSDGGTQDVANPDGARSQGRTAIECTDEWSAGSAGVVRNSASEGLPDWAGGAVQQPRPITEFERPNGREIERDFRGIPHGVSKRVDRLKALGNAVVPQQIYPILQAIADIERGIIQA